MVADEVRQLAERVAAAAKDIASLIEKVQTGMDASVSAMAAVVQDVESGAEKAREAGEGLLRIVDVSQELAGEVATIEHSTKTADTAAVTLSSVIEQVGALAQENNALADQMREQSSGVMEQIDSASSAFCSASRSMLSIMDFNAGLIVWTRVLPACSFIDFPSI